MAKSKIMNLKNEIKEKEEWPIELQLADYECDYYMGRLSQSQIIQEVGGYLDAQERSPENNKIISKGYLNLSKWLNELAVEEGGDDDDR